MRALIVMLLPGAAIAQHGGGGAPPPPVAPKEGAQFDFLVGQWELIGQPQATTLAQRIHGVTKLPGTWKAWRAMDGWGIQDELRLTDPSGNPVLFAHTLRYFDALAKRWQLSGIDVYKGLVSSSSAQWNAGQMVVSGSGKDAEGKTFISRATFSKITPSSFSYRLDLSYDNGVKWTEGITRIDAKRVAAVAPR
jgi:hypothetical protein